MKNYREMVKQLRKIAEDYNESTPLDHRMIYYPTSETYFCNDDGSVIDNLSHSIMDSIAGSLLESASALENATVHDSTLSAMYCTALAAMKSIDGYPFVIVIKDKKEPTQIRGMSTVHGIVIYSYYIGTRDIINEGVENYLANNNLTREECFTIQHCPETENVSKSKLRLI